MPHHVTAHWRQPPDTPELRPNSIDVWRIDLDRELDQAPSGTAPTAPQSSRRQTARRVMLNILGSYLGETLEPPRIAVHPGGKPYLLDAPRKIAFNLSHAQGLGLLAIGCDCDLGVDVEQPRHIDDPLRLAQRALSASEVSHLRSLPDDQRNACFLDLWTRMESRQKALGSGIFAEPVDPQSLSSLSFQPGPGQFACVSVRPPRPGLSLRFFDYHAA